MEGVHPPAGAHGSASEGFVQMQGMPQMPLPPLNP